MSDDGRCSHPGFDASEKWCVECVTTLRARLTAAEGLLRECRARFAGERWVASRVVIVDRIDAFLPPAAPPGRREAGMKGPTDGK